MPCTESWTESCQIHCRDSWQTPHHNSNDWSMNVLCQRALQQELCTTSVPEQEKNVKLACSRQQNLRLPFRERHFPNPKTFSPVALRPKPGHIRNKYGICSRRPTLPYHVHRQLTRWLIDSAHVQMFGAKGEKPYLGAPVVTHLPPNHGIIELEEIHQI